MRDKWPLVGRARRAETVLKCTEKDGGQLTLAGQNLIVSISHKKTIIVIQ